MSTTTTPASTTTTPPNPPGPPKPPLPKPSAVAESAASGSISSNPATSGAPSHTTLTVVSRNPSNPTGSTYPTPLSPTTNNDGHNNVATAAGIGTGIALAVILLALGLFFWIQRRRRKRQARRKSTRKMSFDGAASPDEEIARRLSQNPGMHTTPIVPRELPGDQNYPIELPAPLTLAWHGSGKTERELFGFDDELHVIGRDEKKTGVRLFDDEPIDEIEDEAPPNFADLYPQKAAMP